MTSPVLMGQSIDASSGWPIWLSQDPPHGYVWVPILIAAVSAVISLAALFVQRSDRARDRRSRVEDAWVKAVLLDEWLPDFMRFMSTQLELLTSIAQEPQVTRQRAYLEATKRFTEQMQTLIIKFEMVDAVLSSTYDDVKRALEALEDAVAKHCASNNNMPGKAFEKYRAMPALQRKFVDCQTAIVRSLLTQHHRATLSSNTFSWTGQSSQGKDPEAIE